MSFDVMPHPQAPKSLDNPDGPKHTFSYVNQQVSKDHVVARNLEELSGREKDAFLASELFGFTSVRKTYCGSWAGYKPGTTHGMLSTVEPWSSEPNLLKEFMDRMAELMGPLRMQAAIGEFGNLEWCVNWIDGDVRYVGVGATQMAALYDAFKNATVGGWRLDDSMRYKPYVHPNKEKTATTTG